MAPEGNSSTHEGMTVGGDDATIDGSLRRSATEVGVSGRLIWWVIGIGLVLHFACLWLARTAFAGWTWEHHPVHSAIETAGALIALWVAWILLLLERRRVGTSHNLWIAGAFIGMGLLDGLHALVLPGHTFVWLHSVATLVGGALLVLVWVPVHWHGRTRHAWPWGVALATLTLGVMSILLPDATPAMLLDHEHGAATFSPMARVLNVVGGLLMWSAGILLILDYRRNGNVDDLLFCLPCLLFGSAAVMFEYSLLWDLSWWGWHLLRLLAYGLALAYVVRAQWTAQAALQQHAVELGDYARRLEYSNTELEQFAYVASHVLRSPLRAIDNLARWIEEDAGDSLNEACGSHLALMRQRVVRMEGLLDSLLQYSRVGRRENRPGPVDLNELLRDLTSLLDLPDGFTIEVAPDLPTVHAPRGAIERVFGNLIENAVRHHHRKDGRVAVAWRPLEGFHEFTVRDDGPGIAPEFHDRIFKLFQTLQPRDRSEGSGMGLALVRKTVEHHGGTIRVESQPGHGALFVFTWPAKIGNPVTTGENRDEEDGR